MVNKVISNKRRAAVFNCLDDHYAKPREEREGIHLIKRRFHLGSETFRQLKKEYEEMLKEREKETQRLGRELEKINRQQRIKPSDIRLKARPGPSPKYARRPVSDDEKLELLRTTYETAMRPDASAKDRELALRAFKLLVDKSESEVTHKFGIEFFNRARREAGEELRQSGLLIRGGEGDSEMQDEQPLLPSEVWQNKG